MLFNGQYSYNSANQISSITEPARSRTFGYDNADRLTSVIDSTNGNESYAYDAVGNRTSSQRSTTYSYNPFNELTATQTGSYSFDVSGNTISKSEGSKRWSYFWNYENRLTKAWDRRTTMRYLYDALGRRVSAYAPTKGKTNFTYEGDDVLLDDANGTLTKYINGPGIDNKLRQTTGSSASYFLADHLGSTNGLTDSTGALTASNSYDSFGNPSSTSFPTRYQFTGREFDSTTGLQFSRARWYDPGIGRFISEDPIGFGGGINAFEYVSNNPINRIDPTGLYEIDVHYYLTYYLARKTGCFSDGQSIAIANGDQMTDEVEKFSPGFGKTYQNSTFHALNPQAAPGAGSAQLEANAQNPIDYVIYGRSLHYRQDTFSHAGYDNDYWGLARAGHYWDKTSSDPVRAVRMAEDTWNNMGDFVRSTGCTCKPMWTTEMSETIVTFAIAQGSRTPSLNTIDSTGDATDLFIVNPSGYLNNKIRILGVQPR